MHTNCDCARVAKIRDKNKIALSMLACAILVGNINAYDDPGVLGSTSSWETAEYKKDWGLSSMNASTAYALGFTGEGVKLGIVDSGILMSHSEFKDGRFFTLRVQGVYSKDGMRHPDASVGIAPINKKQPTKDGARNYDESDNGAFKKGEAFDVNGNWIAGVNDAHGTHVAGTVGASRDGKEMHGVAFKSEVYNANHGSNDNTTYGPHLDYAFFYNTYSKLAESGVKFINNSWGSNTRLNSAYKDAPGYFWISRKGVIEESSDKDASLYIKDLEVAKKAYYQFSENGQKGLLDAAYDVAVKNGIVQVYTAGNRRKMTHSYTRAMLPYFRPDAENFWVNVTGQDDKDDQQYNYAGASKWWTIAAPGIGIYSTYIDVFNDATYGKAIYRNSSGTSMSAPHVTGALGVIQSRYAYMTPSQVREVMLTNARQKKLDGSALTDWTASIGTPDPIYGWGILDLGKAMFGPGQFLGNFDVTMNSDDIWSNDISDVALKFRKTEDANEAAIWNARKAALNAKANLSEEEKAEMVFETAREKARADRAAGGYEGALTKRGEGALTLAGSNTFTGATTIYGGKISALNQSIGNSKSIAVEKGGELEILKSVEVKTPSSAGFQVSTRNSDATTVTATIKNGGAFAVNDGVSNLNLTFEDGSLLKAGVASVDQLDNLLKNPSATLTYSASGNFVNPNKASLANDYAFFSLTKELANSSNLKLALKKSADMQDVAQSDGAKTVARAIQAASGSELYKSLLSSTRAEAQNAYSSLANDYGFAAQNNALINSLMLRNGVLNQSNAKRASVDAGVELWISTNLNRITTDKNLLRKFSTNSFTQLLGLDFLVGDDSKVGAFVGLGRTKSKIGGAEEAKDKDTHLGVYGEFGFSAVKFDLGLTHTKTDRERKQLYVAGSGLGSEYKNADQAITSAFAQVAYTGFNGENFGIEPYAGFSYIRAEADGFSNKLTSVSDETRNIQVATLGVRPNIPFALGSTEFKAKADLAYNQFFGDKAPEANINIFGVGSTRVKGAELKDLTTLDVGIDAMITKKAKLGVSYVGAYGSDIKSNGISAKFSLAF